MNSYLRRYNCDNSTIDFSFSSSNVIWNSTWRVLDDLHGSDHFAIMVSIKSDIPNKFNWFDKFYSKDVPFYVLSKLKYI